MVEGGVTRSPVRVLSLLAATILLVFVVWQAPHTVHHLLEDGADLQHGCVLATSADRTPATQAETVVLLHLERTDLGVLATELSSVPALAIAPFPARAPPARAV